MRIEVPSDEYREIEATIANDSSPVGIDAKKTHVLILHMLAGIERRLGRIENQLGSLSHEDAERP